MKKNSKFSKLLPADSKARSFIVLGFVVVALLFGYFYLAGNGSQSTAGKSSTVAIPSKIQNVPGGKLSDEYHQALVRAN